MKLLECLENEAFNELINFSFEEVRTLFNWYAYYVPIAKAEPFVKEASMAKVKYEEELQSIEKYTILSSNFIKRKLMKSIKDFMRATLYLRFDLHHMLDGKETKWLR